MALLHLLSALPSPETDPSVPDFAHDDLHRMRRRAAEDRFGAHALTDDPEAADVILFAERAHAAGPFMEAVRAHPLARRFPDKAFVLNPRYDGVPFLPGVYGCVRRQDVLFPNRVRSCAYVELPEADHLTYDADVAGRPHLFSFVGAARTFPSVREPLLRLEHPRAFLRDTSAQRTKLESDAPFDEAAYRRAYVDLCHDSQFILCPRGLSVNSLRLYEAMRMGRAPVIVSDGWLPPTGPDWDAFSVRIPEHAVTQIPELLERLAPEAEAMGRRARAAWDAWFARDVYFHRVAEWCLEMQAARSFPESVARRLLWTKLAMPHQFRRFARSRYHAVRKRWTD